MRLPFFVFLSWLPKASFEIQREVFFLFRLPSGRFNKPRHLATAPQVDVLTDRSERRGTKMKIKVGFKKLSLFKNFIFLLNCVITFLSNAEVITLSNGANVIIEDNNRYVISNGSSVSLSQISMAEPLSSPIVMKNNATVTLNGIFIHGSGDNKGATISCEGSATIIIADGSLNTLEGFGYGWEGFSAPAIKAGPPGTTLTIKGGKKGTGQLLAKGASIPGYSSSYAPGIGTMCYQYGNADSCGNIILDGGIIIAETDGSVGIGAGMGGRCGDITINDSITKVVTKDKIGGDNCGTITIGTHLNQKKSGTTLTLTPKVHTIKFDANGGEGNTSISQKYGKSIGSLPETTREGYTFVGWFTQKEGGNYVTSDTVIIGDVTYYAQWTPNKYVVTFDTNYGAGSENLQKDYDSALGALPVPKRDGYAFVGWFTAKEGGNRITEETIVSGDVTYYAHWVISPYVFEGDVNWFLEGDGIWRSGKIENNQMCSMKMTLTNACNVSFAWKSSCEGLVKGNPYDYRSFEIDGIQRDFICGESNWQEKIYEVKGNGEHTLEWIFQKDEDGSEGEDCAWIRGITWVYTDVTVDVGSGKSVVVPSSWIDSYADIVVAANGDKAAALQRTAANGRKVWECYVLGLDPTNPLDDFLIARFWMDGNMPKFEFNHTTDGSGNSFLSYVKPLGKSQLFDEWRHVPEGGNPAFRFFTVEVVPPGCESSIVDEDDLGGVQLWENGPYWAECNVGATNPEEYGYYFWWGDTVGYTRSGGTLGDNGYSAVTWVSSTGKKMSESLFVLSLCPTYYKDNADLLSAGYIDSTGNLTPAHDAVTAHLGSPWRMPTCAEFDALENNCTTMWTTRNGVRGLLVTGKGDYADKSIFLPAAGYGVGSSLYYIGSSGGYWSSTPDLDFSGYAWYFNFGSGDFQRKDIRCYGRSVRPVREIVK